MSYSLPHGIVFKSTPSHGYWIISRERWQRIREESPALLTRSRFYHGGESFEEDLEYNRVILAFPAEFPLHAVKNAVKVFRDYHPDVYAKHTGRPVKIENSHELQKRAFYAEHAEDWLAVAAWGDWHEKVPAGYVGVACILGKYAHDRDFSHGEAKFLIPDKDYKYPFGLEYVVPSNAIPWEGVKS